MRSVPPGDRAIFDNIEQGYAIDAVDVGASPDTVRAAGYVPGFSENPINGRFPWAYADTDGVVLCSSLPDTVACPNTTVACQHQIRTDFPAGSYPDVDVVDGARLALQW